MKKTLLALILLSGTIMLFADLEVNIPFDQNVVGPSFEENGNYTFNSEHFTVINNGIADEFHLNVSANHLPEDWSLMWCHELGEDQACHFLPDWDFTFNPCSIYRIIGNMG